MTAVRTDAGHALDEDQVPEGDLLVLAVVPAALRLVGHVRDRDVEESHEILATATRRELQALALVLAALAREDATVVDVLEHCDPATRRQFALDPRLWPQEDLRRAHAAFNRRGRTMWAREGEREYQRRRTVRRREMDRVNREALLIRAAEARHATLVPSGRCGP